MEKTEREATRRERAALEEDLRVNPSRGRPLPLRLRNFRPRADSYLAAARGPLHYMLRLHDIERRLEEHEDALREVWRTLAADCLGDARGFRRRWVAAARAVDFTDVNDLIERHNRWYPIESRLPMDPGTGDFALVNGRDYRLGPLDESWVLERFPPEIGAALPVAPTARA